jgi:predicted  nucleic acid-binding Zn-ribbon protein
MQTNSSAVANTPKEIIEVLCSLQALDDEIRDFRARRKERIDQLDRLRKVIAHMQRDVEEQRGKLAETEQWHRTKSLELETLRDKLNRSKAKLSGVTRSKEYVAVNKELDLLRKDIAIKEDEVEKLSKAIDDFRLAIAKKEADFGDRHAEAEIAERDTTVTLQGMDARIAEVDARRLLITDRLDRAVVKRYERVAEARDGKAVAPVIEEACTGCNMILQPSFVEIVVRATSLVQCRHCNRYLYGDEFTSFRRETAV